MTGARPVWEDLPEPRPATPAERMLLSALVGAVPGPARTAMTAQLDGLLVAGSCRCGCSSLRLAPSGAAVPPDVVAQLSPSSRAEHLGVTASASTPEGVPVSVTLHVLNGRLHELEIFAGEGVATGLPAVDTLTDVTLE